MIEDELPPEIKATKGKKGPFQVWMETLGRNPTIAEKDAWLAARRAELLDGAHPAEAEVPRQLVRLRLEHIDRGPALLSEKATRTLRGAIARAAKAGWRVGSPVALIEVVDGEPVRVIAGLRGPRNSLLTRVWRIRDTGKLTPEHTMVDGFDVTQQQAARVFEGWHPLRDLRDGLDARMRAAGELGGTVLGMAQADGRRVLPVPTPAAVSDHLREWHGGRKPGVDSVNHHARLHDRLDREAGRWPHTHHSGMPTDRVTVMEVANRLRG